MPRRRENILKKLKLKFQELMEQQQMYSFKSGDDQNYMKKMYNVPFPWRAKANGELSGFITPYENVTETMMLNWAKDILIKSQIKLLALNMALLQTYMVRNY